MLRSSESGSGCLIVLYTFISLTLISVTFPLLLVTWHTNQLDQDLQRVGVTLIQGHFGGVAMILPGAFILNGLLLYRLSVNFRKNSLNVLMRQGIPLGIVLSFVNLPAIWLVHPLYERELLSLFQCVFLIALVGLLWGVWVSWTLWRIANPSKKALPQFSLLTLVLAAIFWGFVLYTFQPDPGIRRGYHEGGLRKK